MNIITRAYLTALKNALKEQKYIEPNRVSVQEYKNGAICIDIYNDDKIIVYEAKNENMYNIKVYGEEEIKKACEDFVYRACLNKPFKERFIIKLDKKVDELGYQRNKYMDDLNIPIERYGINFSSYSDKRAYDWINEQEQYGFDNRETWNLNYLFIEWLYSRLMMFNEVNIVDTKYHKIEWQGEQKTMQECIDILIASARECLIDLNADESFDINEEKYNNFCNLMPLWGKLLPYMWW